MATYLLFLMDDWRQYVKASEMRAIADAVRSGLNALLPTYADNIPDDLWALHQR